MEKVTIFAFLVIFVASAVGIYLLGSGITGMFIGFGQPTDAEWWNVSWNYRVRIDVNSTQYSRDNWPIEQEINFTDILPSGTFDINSTRVIEYSQGGTALYEVPSQFDQANDYSASNNALGTLIFIMNGTTGVNTNRTFYLYYDTVENGVKKEVSYSTNLTYSWDGQLITVNNSFMRLFIDTNREENTSGIYRSQDKYDNIIFSSGNSEKTTEYMEYSNGTYNMSFDLIGNASFVNGSVRITVEQNGDEIIFGSPSQQTGEANVTKKYYVYNNAGPQSRGTFIKIVQRVTNSEAYQIQRNSTMSGALAFDVNRTFNSGSINNKDGNTSNPYSWAWAVGIGGELVGVINLQQNGTSNYYTNESSSLNGRIGIQLDDTSIASGSYIEQFSLVYFAGAGGGDAVTEFLGIKDRFINPVEITQSLPEVWYVVNTPSSNATIFNRNETALLIGSVVSDDPYNLTEYMNATIDMGTPDTGDDQTVILYDDGSHEDGSADNKVFANTFEIPNDANVTTWSVNLTTFTNYTEFLNSTMYYFNVTDVFDVGVTILNKNPIENTMVFANIDVMNYNQSHYIAGATINCSFNSTDVVNKTDQNNGTYSVNFTTPSVGDYLLVCNATKNGNLGSNNDTFTSETAGTNVSIVSYPSEISVTNVSLYWNDSFSITANATNVGNGTAYSSNISLQLLAGWDADYLVQDCGDVYKNENCTKAFNITVPNGTTPGSYYINVSSNWTNPDSTLGSNLTSLNVTVESNPIVDLEENNITTEVADGYENYIGNFTVLSIGNDALQNISFDCYQGEVCNNFTLEFNPVNISGISVGENNSVAVNVTVTQGYPVGTYNGTVNVSAGNDGYDIIMMYVTVPTKTNLSITASPENYTVYNITQADNQTFSFEGIAENIGNGSARYANISLQVPSGWTPNSSLENCNNITKNENCTKAFNITVPNGTTPGSYYINVSSNWTNPDSTLGSNLTTLNVTVASNPKINVSQNYVSGNATDAVNSYIGNFTVLSIGNDAIQNVTFNCITGDVCNNFTVNFNPANVSSVNVGNNYSVAVNATVPQGYPAGNYNGTVNVSTENDGYDTFILNVTILPNRSWTLYPTFCEKAEEPEAGTACEIEVINNGNDVINFTVTPENGNYTTVNTTNFSVANGLNYTLVVTYNVTNVTPAIFNSTFLVNATQADANPDNMTFQVNLLPNIPPMMDIKISPNFTEQNDSVVFFTNLTDRSNSGIKWMNVSVTKPDSTTNSTVMTLLNQTGNFSQWYLNYTQTLGNTSLRGVYNVSFTTSDNVGNLGNVSTNFTIYKKMLVTSTTLSGTYYQGDTGSIYFVIKNASGIGINNSNITFTILDPNGNISHYSQEQTNSDGTISPMPTFTLSSDAPIGTYSLFANYSFYDEVLNQTLGMQKNSTFGGESRTITVTGLFADVETSVVWYPNNIMKFGILVYNGEGRPVDPDQINLTVYDPADNIYFDRSISFLTKEATGYYTYSHAMGVGTATGMYMAVLNVSQGSFNSMKIKAFRVSQGGPYDVRINLFENEVPQGDYLDFEIVIENKGEVTQDVFVEYNVTKQGVGYYSFSEAVLTPAYSNQSFTRTAFIYTNQPLGTYVLNAKVTYSIIQSPIDANTTFSVISAAEPKPPPTQSPTGDRPTFYVIKPTQETDASILITGYNNNITLARGFTKIESVIVKNSGRVNLNNMSLFVLGVPTNWFNITPVKYDTLVPGNSSVFLIEFNIPENANTGNYKASLLATSGVVSDQQSIEINIFSSIKEMLETEIAMVEKSLIELKIDLRVAEREGKDVSDVLTIVDTIESYIEDAKDYLRKNDLDSGMESITSALSLIKRARDLLDMLEMEEPEPFASLIFVFGILIAIILVVILLVYLWRKKRLKQMLRPYMSRIKDVFHRSKNNEAELESLKKEKDKIYRMIKVLDKERSEGMITEGTYNRMKDSLESRLNKIEKKLK
ncbi:MAG: NEW3 domain-containing protein [Candidatus Aenigmatarchaeota archaeon]